MILINLLPHREAARKSKRDSFFISLAISALAGGLISGAVYTWYQTQISSQQSQNNFLQTEIKRLESQIKDIAGLQSEIAALRARQQAVEDLAIGCVLVKTHFGAIIIGNFSHKSLIISNEELPEPTIIPARKTVNL